MKAKHVIGALILLLGVLIAIGPFTIFPVCGVTSGGDAMMPMRCLGTAKAELAAGGLITLLGILLLVLKSGRARLWLSLLAVLAGAAAFLIPNVLVGVCGSVHMACRALTLPALSVLSAFTVIAAGINVFCLWKTNK